jgi:hypothetical protein
MTGAAREKMPAQGVGCTRPDGGGNRREEGSGLVTGRRSMEARQRWIRRPTGMGRVAGDAGGSISGGVGGQPCPRPPLLFTSARRSSEGADGCRG